MRAVLQRCRSASVSVAGQIVGEIGPGMVVLVGTCDADGAADVEWLTGKLMRLRIFNDDNGVMNRSLLDTGGGCLVVSQFTLFASTAKGNRPYYGNAGKPDQAAVLIAQLCAALETLLGRPVAQGRFGADMQLSLINDGPVTICLDSQRRE